MQRQMRLRTFLLFFLALAAAATVYWPGLQSAFLFDDLPNLKTLENLHAPVTLSQLVGYAVTNVSGPLGRPLPMLTFALQGGEWPADPAAFKRVNLLLHLTNACLLLWLWLRLGRLAQAPWLRLQAVALFAVTAWMLHPMQVSTVLYVVQRMTQLAVLFTLLGLLAYLAGRERQAQGRRGGYAWMSAGVVLGTALATASKETGALLPLFALVMEATMLRRLPRFPGWNRWAWVFLYGPLLVAAAYLAVRFPIWVLPGFEFRDFTLTDRLFTQPRMLLDYLGQILLPEGGTMGLLHDDVLASRGPLHPVTTLPALGTVALLVFGAFKLRSRRPWLSFGILWFFAGHVLESSMLPLELYFEHRNYLPMAGLLLGAAMEVAVTADRLGTPGMRRVLAAAGLAWLALVTLVTLGQTRLWGDPAKQAYVWAAAHPDSIRAQDYFAFWLAAGGEHRAAGEIFARLAATGKGTASYLSWSWIGCHDANIRLPDVAKMTDALARARYSPEVTAAFERLVVAREAGQCQALGGEMVERIFDALRANPAFAGRRHSFYILMGRWFAADGRTEDALASVRRAYELSPAVETALLEAKIMRNAGRRHEMGQALVRARAAAARLNPVARWQRLQEIEAWESWLPRTPVARDAHKVPE